VQFLRQLFQGMGREKHEIRPLAYPAGFHLRGAEGWLELGDVAEANRELEQIAAEHSNHPQVLLSRWQLDIKAQKWNECLDIALILAERFPDNPCGWIALAQTLYYTQRIAEAYQIGIAKAEEFSESSRLLYDTARYACLLGKRKEAEHYLRLAMAVGDAKSIKLRALADPDLEALWVAREGPMFSKNGLDG
jgi:predicted Zn-dependent protease